MKDDTVSRAAVIETIKSHFRVDNDLLEVIVYEVAHLPAVQTCEDAVSRQQAVDALIEQMPSPFTADGSHPADEGIFRVQETYADCIETIKLLPSVQPETHDKRTETHACDCISRQAAIDALMKRDKELRNINWYDKPYAEGECRGIDEALAIVSNLPSAQPQPVVRCKDCKYRMPYDWMFSEIWRSQNINDYSEDEIGCQYCDMTMKADDFCSRAERRTE